MLLLSINMEEHFGIAITFKDYTDLGEDLTSSFDRENSPPSLSQGERGLFEDSGIDLGKDLLYDRRAVALKELIP